LATEVAAGWAQIGVITAQASIANARLMKRMPSIIRSGAPRRCAGTRDDGTSVTDHEGVGFGEQKATNVSLWCFGGMTG
jgi:hypothetical protein